MVQFIYFRFAIFTLSVFLENKNVNIFPALMFLTVFLINFLTITMNHTLEVQAFRPDCLTDYWRSAARRSILYTVGSRKTVARVPGPGVRPRPRLHELRAGRQQRVDQGVSRPVRRQGQEKGEAMTSSQHYTPLTLSITTSLYFCAKLVKHR